MPRLLIMGFATNQTRESLDVFLRSARQVYSRDECDIALITNSVAGIASVLNETGAIAISTPSTYSVQVTDLTKVYNRIFIQSLRALWRSGALARSPEIVAGYHQLIETWHHPHFARWFAYKRVMQSFFQYEKILLADTKDVVFQSRFFDKIEDDTVSVFEDGESFYPEGWNGRWYIEAYGREQHRKVMQEQPICIGVVAGGSGALLRFVTELCEAIARHPFGRIEQAIFNKMYFAKEFSIPFKTFQNLAGPVFTMAGEGVEKGIDYTDGIIRDTGARRVFPVVHMYDRFDPIRLAVQQRFC